MLAAMWMASRIRPELSVTGAMTTWDGAWYLLVADAGYPPRLPLTESGTVAANTTAFFPLYPAAIRVVRAAGWSSLTAAIVVTAISSCVLVVALWFLLRRIWSARVADRGVALLCFFPGSLVLSMAYSEATMLALVVLCLWALVDRRWELAGIAGALATACRPNALAVAIACAWAAGDAIWRHREWRALAAPLLAPLGFVAFQLFLWRRTGDARAWFKTQEGGWGEQMTLRGNWDRIVATFDRPLGDVNVAVAVAGMLFVLAALVLLVRARPPAALLVYAIGVVLFMATSKTLGARPRFVMTAFPLVVVPALWLRDVAFTAYVAASAVVLGAFTILTTTTVLATP